MDHVDLFNERPEGLWMREMQQVRRNGDLHPASQQACHQPRHQGAYRRFLRCCWDLCRLPTPLRVCLPPFFLHPFVFIAFSIRPSRGRRTSRLTSSILVHTLHLVTRERKSHVGRDGALGLECLEQPTMGLLSTSEAPLKITLTTTSSSGALLLPEFAKYSICQEAINILASNHFVRDVIAPNVTLPTMSFTLWSEKRWTLT